MTIKKESSKSMRGTRLILAILIGFPVIQLVGVASAKTHCRQLWPVDRRSVARRITTSLRRSISDPKDDGIADSAGGCSVDLWETKLVVLSACKTGVGEEKNGEEVIGLRRARALAGSETQVMSLCPVSDLGMADLMIE